MSSMSNLEKIIANYDCEIKPFHSLLLMDERDNLLDKLLQKGHGDNSPVVRVIYAYNPTKNLKIISARSNLTLNETFKIVKYLIYWGFAIIMFPLAETNMYGLSPTFQEYKLNALVDRFRRAFPGHDLRNVMHMFSTPASLIHIMQCVDKYVTTGVYLTEMVIWLLRHNIVTQFHFFLQHITFYNESEVNSGYYGSPAVTFSPLRWERNVFEHFSQPTIMHDPDDLNMLMEFLQRNYLCGQYHVEEIAFLERVQPAVIFKLLNSFQDVIKVYNMEDDVVLHCNDIKNRIDATRYVNLM